MIALRATKTALVGAIALFATIVVFGNLTDYNTNLLFIQHVLSMDTIYPFFPRQSIAQSQTLCCIAPLMR
jgi:predicted small integral membrane protein